MLFILRILFTYIQFAAQEHTTVQFEYFILAHILLVKYITYAYMIFIPLLIFC